MLSAVQLEARKHRVTSSNIAGALGLNPNMTPIAAWEAIRGESSFAGNKATERGSLLELAVLDYPCGQLNLTREDARFITNEDWDGDSTDAVYRSNGEIVAIGEGKTVALGASKGWGEPGTDQVPAHVLVQSYWHLIHWPAAKQCLIPVLFGGYEFKFELYIVERDELIQAALWDRAKEWWEHHIRDGIQPAVNAGDTEWLKQKFPRDTRGDLDPPAEFDRVVAELLSTREALREVESREGQLTNQVRSMLGEFGSCRSGLYSVTYRNNKSSVVTNWEALALALNPSDEQIGIYSSEKPGARVLRVSELKGKKK